MSALDPRPVAISFDYDFEDIAIRIYIGTPIVLIKPVHMLYVDTCTFRRDHASLELYTVMHFTSFKQDLVTYIDIHT